jgi:copper(I)-binding protein
MTGSSRRALLGVALGLAALRPAAAQHAAAPPASAGTLRISNAWTRAAGAGGNGAGFLTVANGGTAPDRLLAARSAAARVVELHTMIRDGEVMRMRPVTDIPLPAGQEVRLQPGGLHIMLIGLTAPLQQGTRVPLTLVFERAGEVQVELAVEAAGARAPGGAHRH